MQIILVHPRLAQARSLKLTRHHAFLFSLAMLMTVLFVSLLLCYTLLRHAAQSHLPFLRNLLPAVKIAPPPDPQVQQKLAIMAARIGEMQAQLVRLDALGERVRDLADVKPEEFDFKASPARGGTDTAAISGRQIDVPEFGQLLEQMSRELERRADRLATIEEALSTKRVEKRLLPTSEPVALGYRSSNFGWRFDPFNGRNTLHEGIDFAAPAGTPILSAAPGVIITAERHPQFGNMIEIDHGNGIVTRYAHASKLRARVGEIVERGQQVADVGATGRATGAHLHFEVLVNGVHQDPEIFLSAGAARALKVAAAQ
ncbi:M23 family metallopeptidase [Noviherbaspirillum pedocola]|uniref:M23 family metallopeptidase n=1 Tax=Noviherbaspirillum pedocola TaxID=2801341 RepID=A0A934SXD7_9BURK|nr:M23 family metallopeptidase [Noviherbaspirillum pedocola]MBK4733538.1 M23 family metallopeptidase [Noviherbaspirillum pedocola]